MATAKAATIANLEFTKGVSKRFRELVDESGIRHQDVAKALGIAERSTQALYNGTYPYSISGDTAAAIADFFEISMDEFRK